MKITVHKIGVASVAKLYACLMGCIALIIAVPFSLVLIAMDKVSGAVAVLIFIPIFYSVMGLFVGAVGATCYNFAARTVGGIEIETESSHNKRSKEIHHEV